MRDSRIACLTALSDCDLYLQLGQLFGGYLWKVARNAFADDPPMAYNDTNAGDLICETLTDTYPYIVPRLRERTFADDKALAVYLGKSLRRKIHRHKIKQMREEKCRQIRERELRDATMHIVRSRCNEHDDHLDCDSLACRVTATLPLDQLLLRNLERFTAPHNPRPLAADMLGITEGHAAVLRHRGRKNAESALMSNKYPASVSSLLSAHLSDNDLYDILSAATTANERHLDELERRNPPVSCVAVRAMLALHLPFSRDELLNHDTDEPLASYFTAAVLFKSLFAAGWFEMAYGRLETIIKYRLRHLGAAIAEPRKESLRDLLDILGKPSTFYMTCGSSFEDENAEILLRSALVSHLNIRYANPSGDPWVFDPKAPPNDSVTH